MHILYGNVILMRDDGNNNGSCIPDEKIQGFGQGQKYRSKPDVVTLLF